MLRLVDIREASRAYERWLGERVPLVRGDLALKHRLMSKDVFSFLRATFYRWAQLWPDVCHELADAPAVLAVGDLHVENFGTWRDAEGRLIWGVNDFDEVVSVPYTQDLVRLGTSALLAVEASPLTLSARRGCESILEGYTESLRTGGGAAVLAERYSWLRDLAVARLKDQRPYWDHMRSLRTVSGRVDERVRDQLVADLQARVELETIPSVANFVLCHLPPEGPDAASVCQHCRMHGVYLRDAANMSRSLGTHALRIAVKDAETNHRVVDILSRVLARTTPGSMALQTWKMLTSGEGQ